LLADPREEVKIDRIRHRREEVGFDEIPFA
jgi:hypothetical protein